jgi:DNA repair photolyase
MIDGMARLPYRARGAGVDPIQRFTGRELLLDGDELDHRAASGEGDAAPTRVFRDASRSIISRNDSPDIPFDASLNPYRGCEHGCSYCLAPDTRITLADGSARALRDVGIGDRILGTVPGARYRHLVTTEVRDVWRTFRRAYRVTLTDGTVLVASGDHRFLTHRGWKHVTGTQQGQQRRPHLTQRDVVMGIGGHGALAERPAALSDRDYHRGYLTGMIRGEGTIATYDYGDRRRKIDVQHVFRLALKDPEALDRVHAYLELSGIMVDRRPFQKAARDRAPLEALGSRARHVVDRIRHCIEFPPDPPLAWYQGFAAGLFDAEGGANGTTLRLFTSDEAIIWWLERSLETLHVPFVREPSKAAPHRPVHVVRLTGGLTRTLRFFDATRPAITRKRRFEGMALKRSGDVIRVARVEDLGHDVEMVDLTTGTGDFLAEGIVSHNCYARPSHEYLGLSAGLDFERTLFAKPDAPELLAAELAKPSWAPRHLALSGVTDAYQPVERRLGITRGCLEVLAAHRQPVGVITKNALVTRDLDLLAELARYGAARVAVSLTTLDEDLRRRLEPRTSTATARLGAIRTLADAGVPVSVVVAPVIPGLNDHEIPAILAAAADHGAHGAAWTLLRLPGAVEAIFVDWLGEQAPLRAERVLARLREARGGQLDDPRFGHRMRGTGTYVEQLGRVFEVHRRRVGLERTWAPLATEHFRVPGRASQGRLF